MTNCLFFGDSITYGEYDGILGGWVDHLKRFCHGKYYHENANEVNVFNLGIGGENTEGLITRIENEIKARLSPDANLVFLLYGANDLAIKKNEEAVSIEQFEKNITHSIEISSKFTNEIFLLNILPISSKIDGITVSSGKLRTNSCVSQYNQVLEKIAVSKNVTLIDINTLLSQNIEEYLSKDGVHPNEKGYKQISEFIKPIIEPYL